MCFVFGPSTSIETCVNTFYSGFLMRWLDSRPGVWILVIHVITSERWGQWPADLWWWLLPEVPGWCQPHEILLLPLIVIWCYREPCAGAQDETREKWRNCIKWRDEKEPDCRVSALTVCRVIPVCDAKCSYKTISSQLEQTHCRPSRNQQQMEWQARASALSFSALNCQARDNQMGTLSYRADW